MKNKSLTLGASVAIVQLLSGCATHLFSPPARLAPLETAAILAPSQTGLQIEGGGGGMGFGPSIATGSVRVRHGVNEVIEVAAEGNALFVIPENNPTHLVPSLRLGVKLRVHEYLAFTAGVGGGASTAGGFLSPDIGTIFSYENPYFVPFVSVRVWTSSPIAARTLTLPTNDQNESFAMYSPRFTLGMAASLGFRVPFARDEFNVAHAGFLFGLSLFDVVDSEDQSGGGMITAGFEHVF